MLSTGHGRKSDNADATWVGITALTAIAPPFAAADDEAITVLRALIEHRDDIVKTRTETVNSFHVLLARLLPGGAPRDLDADKAASSLRPIRPSEIEAAHPSGSSLSNWSPRSVTSTDASMPPTPKSPKQCTTSGSTLSDLPGIGTLTAGKDPGPHR